MKRWRHHGEGGGSVVSTDVNWFHGRINHKTCAIFYTLWSHNINVSTVVHSQNPTTSPYCCVVQRTVVWQVSQSAIGNCVWVCVCACVSSAACFFFWIRSSNVCSGLHWLRNALSRTARALESCLGLNSLWIRIHVGIFFSDLYESAYVFLYVDKGPCDWPILCPRIPAQYL